MWETNGGVKIGNGVFHDTIGDLIWTDVDEIENIVWFSLELKVHPLGTKVIVDKLASSKTNTSD